MVSKLKVKKRGLKITEGGKEGKQVGCICANVKPSVDSREGLVLEDFLFCFSSVERMKSHVQKRMKTQFNQLTTWLIESNNFQRETPTDADCIG